MLWIIPSSAPEPSAPWPYHAQDRHLVLAGLANGTSGRFCVALAIDTNIDDINPRMEQKEEGRYLNISGTIKNRT